MSLLGWLGFGVVLFVAITGVEWAIGSFEERPR